MMASPGVLHIPDGFLSPAVALLGWAIAVVVLVLEGKDAVKRHRDLMGATDPAKATTGTIRKAHGTNIEYNAVHGSDSAETARFEIGYFFPEMDLVVR